MTGIGNLVWGVRWGSCTYCMKSAIARNHATPVHFRSAGWRWRRPCIRYQGVVRYWYITTPRLKSCCQAYAGECSMPSLTLSSSGLPSLPMDEISGSQLAQRLCPVRMATRQYSAQIFYCMHAQNVQLSYFWRLYHRRGGWLVRSR